MTQIFLMIQSYILEKGKSNCNNSMCKQIIRKHVNQCCSVGMNYTKEKMCIISSILIEIRNRRIV